MGSTPVEKAYAAETVEDQQAAYDEWAAKYEADLCAMGYRIPAVIASVFALHVPLSAAPILDAGCGGGIQAEPLAMLGYGPIVGIDLSDGMLAIAREKNLYGGLHRMTLGERLGFDDDSFAAIVSSGVITPKHAPPESFGELVRVARPGAPIVFSLRNDAGQEPEFPTAVAALAEAGAWTHVFSTDGFQSMPYGEPGITHQVHVYVAA